MAQRRLIYRPNGIRCPDCGGPVVHGEGRIQCVMCGRVRRRA